MLKPRELDQRVRKRHRDAGARKVRCGCCQEVNWLDQKAAGPKAGRAKGGVYELISQHLADSGAGILLWHDAAAS
jgi:hypothetical protein